MAKKNKLILDKKEILLILYKKIYFKFNYELVNTNVINLILLFYEFKDTIIHLYIEVVITVFSLIVLSLNNRGEYHIIRFN